ncbi:MAG: hypothetical protein IT306_05520 [Chloroflexi bacterium]|nr:hypothetical protein [Chloroflexota bacterium]
MHARPIARRAVLGGLLGLGGVAAWAAVGRASERWFGASGGPGPTGRWPAWVSRSPKSRNAYSVAFANLELMATLPCYCGCGVMPKPHINLADCFVQANGEVEEHASGCETCQDEALDAVAWANAGNSWAEIHTRIVAEYSERGPAYPGHRG